MLPGEWGARPGADRGGLVDHEVTEPARAEDADALAGRPRLDDLPDGAPELMAAPRRRLVGWVVRVQEHGHDGNDPRAHQPLVHEAPGVTEGRVTGLHPHVRDVELVLAGEVSIR
jgi:hypothetical protein